MRWITPRTPPKVARAQIEAWQAEQELALFDSLARRIRMAQEEGLETRRIGRLLSQLGAGLEKVGGG